MMASPNRRVQPTSCVAYRMEYHGQRAPLKRKDVMPIQSVAM